MASFLPIIFTLTLQIQTYFFRKCLFNILFPFNLFMLNIILAPMAVCLLYLKLLHVWINKHTLMTILYFLKILQSLHKCYRSSPATLFSKAWLSHLKLYKIIKTNRIGMEYFSYMTWCLIWALIGFVLNE